MNYVYIAKIDARNKFGSVYRGAAQPTIRGAIESLLAALDGRKCRKVRVDAHVKEDPASNCCTWYSGLPSYGYTYAVAANIARGDTIPLPELAAA